MKKIFPKIISSAIALVLSFAMIAATVLLVPVNTTAASLASDSNTIDSKINGNYQFQIAKLSEDGTVGSTKVYKKKTGLCNICALENVLNRRLALDGKYDASNQFTYDYVTRISCYKLPSNNLSATQAQKLAVPYIKNYYTRNSAGEAVASNANGIVLTYDTDGYCYNPIYSCNGKNYQAVRDDGEQTQKHLAELLDAHHEGVFVRFYYDSGSGGHCVVVKKYTVDSDGKYTFYVVDTGRSKNYDVEFSQSYIGSKVAKINSSSIDFIMYLKSVTTAAPFAQGGTYVTEPDSTLSVSAVKMESTSFEKGSSCNITGTVTSNYPISSIKGTINDSAGNAVQTKTIKPNTTSVNIKSSDINNSLKFGSLSKGNYTLVIKATDSKKSASKTISFTVTEAAASTLKISDCAMDSTDLKVGSSCNIKGTIKSNYDITSVTGTILNSSGTEVQKKTINPNAKSVDIKSSDINKELKFGNLAAGSYTLTIKAKDSKKSVSKSISFKVTKPTTTTASTLTVDKVAPAKTTLAKGSSCNIIGTISSNYNITSVTGDIKNSSGIVVQTKTINPSAKTVDIKASAINNELKFGSLEGGTYTFVIKATDASNTTKSRSVSFTVSAINVNASLASTSINYGSACNITGTITSTFLINQVTGTIYNSAGNSVQSQSVSTGTTSFDLKSSAINSNLSFGKLAKGSYSLVITAYDSKGISAQKTIKFTIK